MKKKIVLVLMILLFVSCSKKNNFEVVVKDGISTVINNGSPSDSSFHYTIRSIGLISSNDSLQFRNIVDLKEDENGDVFISDYRSSKISKFSKDLNYLFSFGSRGKGPGEYPFLEGISIAKDTVYVADGMSLKLVKFSTDGNYISDKYFNIDSQFPFTIVNTGDINISQMIYVATDTKGNEIYHKGLNLFDKSLNFIKKSDDMVIFNTNSAMSKPVYNSDDEMFNFCADSNLIYVAKNSSDEYSVDVYDQNLSIVNRITKRFPKVEMSADIIAKNKLTAQENDCRFEGKYFKSIYDIKIDKFNRLWVATPKNRDGILIYDIYDKGIFINTCNIKIPTGHKLIYIGKRIYLLNTEKQEIEVYDYS